MPLYKPPESENWWIDIRHAGQRIRRSAGTTDRQAAQEYHDRVKAELWRQDKLGDRPQYTWNEAVLRWLAEHAHKKSLDDDKDRLRWLSKYLSGVTLTSITTDTIEAIIKARLAEPAGGGKYKRKETSATSPSTVNRYIAALSAVLHSAVKWGWLDAAPRMRKLPEPKKRIAYLTREEACRLIAELPMHLAEMAAFTLATGLRENNVLELEWRDVDTARRVAWIHGDRAKNAKPLAVPLNTNALAVLGQRKATKENLRFVFSYQGKPIGKATNHAWHKALERTGLGHYEKRGDEQVFVTEFHWHDLRHTWASWHVMAGTPLEVLMELGGWSDLRMVMRYAHLSPGHVAQYADRLQPMGRFWSQEEEEAEQQTG